MAAWVTTRSVNSSKQANDDVCSSLQEYMHASQKRFCNNTQGRSPSFLTQATQQVCATLSRQFMALGGRDLSNTPDTVKTAFQASQKCHTVYKRPNQACCMLRAKVHIDCIFSSMLASWDCIVQSTNMCSRLRLAPPSTPIETRGLVDSPDLDRACFFIVCN